MTFTPILTSDTTAAFLLPVVVLFWIGIGGATLGGLLTLGLYPVSRVKRVWGILLGLISLAAGAGGVMFFIIFTSGVELVGWAGVVTPLMLGVVDVLLWKSRRLT